MSSISIDDVKKLAKLSALVLPDDELLTMRNDLDQILDYVTQLQAIDTTDVPPMYQPHDLESVTREDVIVDYGLSREDLLRNAPAHDDASIIVPRVLE